MASALVRSYEEDVVEKRRRTIHVMDELTARVSLWHGGIKIDDVGGWTNTSAALEDALRVARRYSIDGSSTLRIRVCEEVRRFRRVLRGESYGHPVYENEFPKGDVLVLRRHVWDDVAGVIETRLVSFGFRLRNTIGYPVGEDAEATPRGFYSDAQGSMDDAGLWRGLGIGEASIESVKSSPCDAPKSERGDSGVTWKAIAIEGNCRIHVPVSMNDAEALDLLGRHADVRVSLDWGFLGEAARRWRVYSPDDTVSWSYGNERLDSPVDVA